MKLSRLITIVVVVAVALGISALMIFRPWGSPAAVADPHAGHGGHGGHEGEGEHSEENEGVVPLTPQKLEELGVKIEKVGPGTLDIELVLNGEVSLNNMRVAHVVPRVPGIVREVTKHLGDSVKAGDTLAVVESAALAETKAAYLGKLQTLELAKVDLERTQTINTNTQKVLELLKKSPPLEELTGIESVDLGANRGELITAYAEAIGSASALERQKRLLADKIGSEADFRLAQTAYQKAWATYVSLRDQLAFTNKRALDERTRAVTVAEAELKSAERHLFAFGFPSAAIPQLTTESPEQIGRYELKSPLGGSIIEQHIVLGEMLKDDSQPFVVADLESLWVNLIAYQKDLPLIKSGQKVTISFGPNLPESTGAVTYISPLLNDAARAAMIRMDLPNPNGKWRPGLFVTGRVTVETKEVPLLLPLGAIQSMDGKSVVFVQTKRGLERRPVTLGVANSTHVEITSGLSTGKPVAVTNTFIVKAELSKAEAEHVH